MTVRVAEQIADAVLYEGYVLYPYRASAAKNRFRWQTGIVAPRDFAEAAACDPWFMQTECLADIEPGATVSITVRGLHVQERTIEQAVAGCPTPWIAVESLVVGDRQLIAWEEAVRCEFAREGFPADADTANAWCWPWSLEPAVDVETVLDERGQPAARIVRRRRQVDAVVRLSVARCGSLAKISVRVENVTACSVSDPHERDAAARTSLAGTHTILAIEHGAFISLFDPPAFAASAAASCRNEHTWPVLVGPAGTRRVMLSSPVILYDYPSVAPESPGDLCDATEIDEMLMLRVRTLTDDEKREARATDVRAADIIDRADAATPESMARLHGAIRRWETFLNPSDDPPADAAWVDVDAVRIGSGSRVRLKPSRRADSLDICLDGRTATVTAVYRTLEDTPYVAVTLDDDPFGTSGVRYRRALFFHPDELVPLGPDQGDGR